MQKPAKSPDEWLAILFKDWPSRLALAGLIAFSGFLWAQGKRVMDAKVLEIVKPSMDTLAKKQESTDSKVEKVDQKVDALISILVEAFPQVKKAAQERTQKNRDSQDVQAALAGESK